MTAGTTDGYAVAFFEVAKMLGIEAQPLSSKVVWETQMRPRLLEALPIAPLGGADIRSMPLSTFALQAQDIVDRPAVIRIWTACQFDELHEDGQQWICGIVREMIARTRSLGSVTSDRAQTGGRG